jgi:hypothetical protein
LKMQIVICCLKCNSTRHSNVSTEQAHTLPS